MTRNLTTLASRLSLLLLLLLIPQPADACHRCGIFGRGCRFSYIQQPYYYQPQQYQTPSTVVINNAASPAALLPQSNAVYGMSLAAQPLNVDSSLVLDRSARVSELAIQLANTGINGYNTGAQYALAVADAQDRRQKNYMLAMTAMTPTPQPAPQSFTIQFQNGQPTIVQPQPQNYQQPTQGQYSPPQNYAQPPVQPQKAENQRPTQAPTGQLSPLQNPNDPPPPAPTGPIALTLTNLCFRCHDGAGGEGRGPVGLVINDGTPMSDPLYHKTVAKIMAGAMPPRDSLQGVELQTAQKAQLVSQASRLHILP